MSDESEEYTDARASFGQHVKSLRRARGLTQAMLGRRCGLSGDTIRRIEAGGISPTLDTILKLANGLELLPSTLFESFELSGGGHSRELLDLVGSRNPLEVRLATQVMRALFGELDVLLAELSLADHDRSFDDGAYEDDYGLEFGLDSEDED
ncbi:MAG: helix-turn-helix domain-containing protein [Deltaproteobacteria bacterium]|nr:helix-turn-helix domain-containing protein [Deltaproteobacteria bacterium]